MVGSCARKNRRVYDFLVPDPPVVSRIELPYVVRFTATPDKKLDRYNLVWAPLAPHWISLKVRFMGYNIYRSTSLGFLPRQPILQVPPGTNSCIEAVSSTQVSKPVFAIAPVFCDELNREIIGLMTLAFP